MSHDFALGEGQEQGHERDGDHQGPEVALDDHAVLQDSDRLVVDPNVRAEDPAEQRLFLVLFGPGLVGEGIRRAEAVEGSGSFGAIGHAENFVGRERCFIIATNAGLGGRIPKLFPRTQTAAMRGVKNDAKTAIRCNADGEADQEEWGRKEPPPAGLVGKDEENAQNKSSDDVNDAGITNEEDSRSVSIADGPSHKVRMRLATEIAFNQVPDWRESRGMSSVL